MWNSRFLMWGSPNCVHKSNILEFFFGRGRGTLLGIVGWGIGDGYGGRDNGGSR